MSKHLERDLDDLQKNIMGLASLVEQAFSLSIIALRDRNPDIARDVIQGDVQIDMEENQINEDCLKILALHQPVAGDLRRCTAAMMIITDLERMGDLAHHIAKVARLRHPDRAIPEALLLPFTEMGHVAEKLSIMVAGVITTRDTEMALQVEKDDDEMDDLHKKVISTIINEASCLSIETAIDLTLLGRYYERYADHAVSVARRVYFLVTGTFA